MWNEKGVCYGGKDAEKLAADVQTRNSRKDGAGGPFSGEQSKLSTADQVESRIYQDRINQLLSL